MNNDWLQELEVGDLVIVDDKSLRKVEGVSKTLILVHDRVYKRKDGWTPGAGWNRGFLLEATQEAIARMNILRDV